MTGLEPTDMRILGVGVLPKSCTHAGPFELGTQVLDFSHENPQNPKTKTQVTLICRKPCIRAELNCIVKNAFEMEVGVYLRLNP